MGTVQNHLEGQMYIRPHSTGTDVNQPLDKPSQDDLQAVDALCLRHALMNQRDPQGELQKDESASCHAEPVRESIVIKPLLKITVKKKLFFNTRFYIRK